MSDSDVLFHGPQWTQPQFLQQVETYAAQVAAFQSQYDSQGALKVLLFDEDIAEFAVKLFALASQQCEIYLAPNGQPETLGNLIASVDAVALPESDSFRAINIHDRSPLSSDATLSSYWPDAGSITFFTSGSTAKAKAITKTWWQLNRELNELTRQFTADAAQVSLATVGHQHIYGLLFALLLPLKQKLTIYPRVAYPEHLVPVLQCYKAVLVSSPAHLSRLSDDNILVDVRHALSAIFSSGGPLCDGAAITLAAQLGQPVTQVYGSTESGGIAWRQVEDKPCLWQPFHGVRIEAHDAGLAVHSPWIAETSLLLPDKGRVLDDGRFELQGRLDRTVKLEEKRVDLEAMESQLKEHAWVEDCRILPIQQSARRVLGAVVVLNDFGRVGLQSAGDWTTRQQLREHLLRHFELVCLPKKWRYPSSLPFNTQGKIPMTELEALFD